MRLEPTFQTRTIAKLNCCCIRAEHYFGAADFRSGECNPETRVAVACVQYDGVITAFADFAPQACIYEAEKVAERGMARAIRFLRPRIPVEQRNIPLHFNAELLVNAGFGAHQTTVRYFDIEARIARHFAKYGRGVLYGVSGDEEYAIAALRHCRAPEGIFEQSHPTKNTSHELPDCACADHFGERHRKVQAPNYLRARCDHLRRSTLHRLR